MRWPRGIPADLDPGTTARVERSFLVVRVVRGSLLVLFLVVAATAVQLKGWPYGVTIGLVLAAVLLAARLVADVRRLSAPGDRPPRGLP